MIQQESLEEVYHFVLDNRMITGFSDLHIENPTIGLYFDSKLSRPFPMVIIHAQAVVLFFSGL